MLLAFPIISNLPPKTVMSCNPDSIEAGGQFSASQSSTGRSSQNPEAGWDSDRSELKHQPGRNVVEQNIVDILPKGTHLPPDRTFLPQNAGRAVAVSSGDQDAAGTGLRNDQILDTLTGSTSQDVYQGIDNPSEQSKQEARTLGDGERKKAGSRLARSGHSEILAADRQKQHNTGTDYVGNSRE